MIEECGYCRAPNIPVGGSNNCIDSGHDCECEMDKQTEKIRNPGTNVYKNRCWKCKSKIDSRVCVRDPKRDYGYICKACGTSLKYPKRKC